MVFFPHAFTFLPSYFSHHDIFQYIIFFPDYNLGGVLFSNAYHIGGQFVGGVGWQWVDGTPVDPSLLNSYSILGVDGDCLFWDSLYLLIQDKCDTSERILCEQVPPVIWTDCLFSPYELDTYGLSLHRKNKISLFSFKNKS